MTKSHNGADSQDESTSCRLVDDYLSTLKEGKTALVISPTHAAGDTLTEQIRDRLMLEGKLGEEREFTKLVPLHYTEAQLKEARTNPEEGVVLQRFGAYKPETIHIAKGDLLRATSGIKDIAGHRIDNGSMLTVVGFDKGIQVRTGSDAIRTLDPGVGHLTHGYVTTSHASQGRTVDRVMIDMTAANFPAVGAEQFYVSVSRGRQQATIYTDSVDQLRHAIQKHDHRPFALDLVERPKKKVRRNHKKYLSWMRNALIVARDAIRGHQPEVSREREGSFSRG